jgi:hypothetical protein
LGKVVFHWDDLRHTAFDTSPLRLTAIAASDSFYYLISDKEGSPCATKGVVTDNKYHLFDKPLGYLGRLIGDDDLLYADFEKVCIAVRAVPFTALPSGQADDFMRSKLLEITDLSPADGIFCDEIDDQLSLAFALPEVFSREAHAWFSNARIMHVMSALVSQSLEFSQDFADYVLIVNVTHDLIEVVLCSGGALMFANHFRISGREDVLYYVLAVLRDQDVTTGRCHVICTGHDASQVVPQLSQYFTDIEMQLSNTRGTTADFPTTETRDLISILKCAS